MLWTPALEVSSFFWRTTLPLDHLRVSLEKRKTWWLCQGELLTLLVVQTVFTCKQDLLKAHLSTVLALQLCFSPSPQAVLALCCLPRQGQPGWLWSGSATPSPLLPPCRDRACFIHRMTPLGGKNPSTTTLKLTLGGSLFTHTKYFAVLALIAAHIQT